MNKDKPITGHMLALITIIIWGTTFISTKILLNTFSPIEILFFRFALAFIALSIIYPHKLIVSDKKQELYFAFAGLCGVTLYFLLENIALTFTLAANIGILVSISPFFTAIFAQIFLKEKNLNIKFVIGFIVAIIGIFLISFNGQFIIKLNTLGDILGILAAIVWSIYSILTKKISNFHYNTIQTTRRIFLYGLIFMLPALFIFPFKINILNFSNITYLLNILYLGLGASAICFVTWNKAIEILGAVKTSTYIYIVPVVTIITSFIVLKEKITIIALVGALLTLAGLFISENKIK